MFAWASESCACNAVIWACKAAIISAVVGPTVPDWGNDGWLEVPARSRAVALDPRAAPRGSSLLPRRSPPTRYVLPFRAAVGPRPAFCCCSRLAGGGAGGLWWAGGLAGGCGGTPAPPGPVIWVSRPFGPP